MKRIVSNLSTPVAVVFVGALLLAGCDTRTYESGRHPEGGATSGAGARPPAAGATTTLPGHATPLQ